MLPELLNLVTIFVVALFFAFVFIAYKTQPVTEDGPKTPGEIFKSMSLTRNFETIRMTEPLSVLLKDNGSVGGFEPIENYTTYMVTF